MDFLEILPDFMDSYEFFFSRSIFNEPPPAALAAEDACANLFRK